MVCDSTHSGHRCGGLRLMAMTSYLDGRVEVHAGDCLSVLPTLADKSVDAIVTDPPSGISVMQKAWDHDNGGRDHWIAWMQEIATEALRVIKPGGHALVWALPRTSHWTATAWENAGWTKARKDNADWLTVGKWLDYAQRVEMDEPTDAAREWPAYEDWHWFQKPWNPVGLAARLMRMIGWGQNTQR